MLKKMGKKTIKPNIHKTPSCGCGHCSEDDIAPGIVAVKSSSVKDLERDELLIYNALRLTWNEETPFRTSMEELQAIAITIASGTCKKELSKLHPDGKVYDLIPVNDFVKYPIELTKEYIISEYIPMKTQQLEESNEKWLGEGKEERIYTESRLLTLCIDVNTELDTLCKVQTMFALQYFPYLLEEDIDKRGL